MIAGRSGGAELRHLQADLACAGLQVALVAPGPHVLARLTALVAARAAKPVSLRVQHRIQRFLDGAAHHLAEMIPDPRLVDLDHLVHRSLFRLVIHAQPISAILKRNRHARQMCERSCALSSGRRHPRDGSNVRHQQRVGRDPEAETARGWLRSWQPTRPGGAQGVLPRPSRIWVLKRRAYLSHRAPQRLPAVARPA